MSTQKTVMLPFEEGERHSPSVPDGASFSGHMDMQDNLQSVIFFLIYQTRIYPVNRKGLIRLNRSLRKTRPSLYLRQESFRVKGIIIV